MYKQCMAVIAALVIGLGSAASVDARGFSSGGGFRSSSFSSHSYSSPSRSFSSPSYKPSTPAAAPSRFTNSQYNMKPAQTVVVNRPVYSHPVYGGYGYHPYYHNSWYNPGGNFWFWMWIFDHHNNQTVVMGQPGASGGYAVTPAGPSFGSILLNILLLALITGAVIWIVRSIFFRKRYRY